MTITDTQAAAAAADTLRQADAAQRQADAAHHDVAAVIALVGYVEQSNLAAQTDRAALRQLLDGVELLAGLLAQVPDTTWPTRENALHTPSGAVDVERVVEYLQDITARNDRGEFVGGCAGWSVLERMSHERLTGGLGHRGHEVANNLRSLARSHEEHGQRLAGRASVQPALPPGAPREPARQDGEIPPAPPETELERTGQMLRRNAGQLGITDADSVIAVTTMDHQQPSGMTPQQAGDQARHGVDQEPTRVLPIVAAAGLESPELPPFDLTVVGSGSRTHGTTSSVAGLASVSARAAGADE